MIILVACEESQIVYDNPELFITRNYNGKIYAVARSALQAKIGMLKNHFDSTIQTTNSQLVSMITALCLRI